MQPCLKEVTTKFNFPIDPIIKSSNYLKEATSIYRNQLYTQFYIIDSKLFEEAKNKDIQYYISYIDPLKNKKTTINFTKNDIKDIKDGSTLPKIAAHYQIKTIEEHNKKSATEISIKYQVLCKSTAIVGVIKQADKSALEIKSVTTTLRE